MRRATLACVLILAGWVRAEELTGPQGQAWNVLTKGLVEGDPDHRREAVVAIGTLGNQSKAVELVEKALQDKDVLVRQSAAATLGEMGATDAIPYLEAALDDTPEVSFTAARALWKLGNDKGRFLFRELLIGERKDSPGMIEGALRDARRKLRSPSQLALMGVKEASGTFLGPASISITVAQEALKDSGAAGRAAAVEILAGDPDPYALTLLEWAVADKNWAVRAAVAKALGQRGGRDDISKLMPLLTDDRRLVRFMAAASILKLSQKSG